MSEPIDIENSVHSIPDEHFAAIGRAANAWATLEFEIDLMIWELMDVPQSIGACVTAQLLSVLPKLFALRALSNLLQLKESSKMLGTFIGEIGPWIDKRNRIIHDRRFVNLPSLTVVRYQVSAKNKLVFTAIPESVDDLNEFREKAVALTTDFETISKTIERERALSDILPPPRQQIMKLTRD